MIDRSHDLSITKQAEILNISRGSVYYLPRPVSVVDLAIMRRLDRLHTDYPFAGSRMLHGLLVAEGGKVIVAGNTEASELLRRISLDPQADEFMPAEGKPPLTAQQREIIRWWIAAGRCAGGAPVQ